MLIKEFRVILPISVEEPEEDPYQVQISEDRDEASRTNWKQEKRLFTNFHRRLFCWMGKSIELNMGDVRRMEEEAARAR
ncbi:phosphatidylinositol transfer protein beta isoform isoform X3 [Lates japonicus]|uniref:Phosphatidylinositol transfer protein beta isoform isoform X3 n=1 Tax=Lates japonicus TaxID=270547 RepID=A0AAD3RNA8_LATJO|nr:phosphatidylinositol transfer protein beta isoform isoform X3 [Lates japonicus]